MKTDTQLLNEIAHNTNLLRRLTEDEVVGLKKALLKIHNYLISVCDENSIEIMLGGGSCLGAIRHNGFIPWDDDLDLMMTRSNYERLIELWERGEIDKRYHFEYPNNKKDVKNTYLKVFLSGTKYIDIFDSNNAFPTSISVDVFPIDFAPDNPFLRRLKGYVSDGLQFICTCTLYAQYPNEILSMLYKHNLKANIRFQTRLLLGRLLSFVSHQRWVYWFDKMNKRSKPSGLMTVPTGRKHYWSETLPTSVFIPASKCMFAGSKSYLPNDYHTYLLNLYGDYMQVPPEDKRERHFIVDFSI